MKVKSRGFGSRFGSGNIRNTKSEKSSTFGIHIGRCMNCGEPLSAKKSKDPPNPLSGHSRKRDLYGEIFIMDKTGS